MVWFCVNNYLAMGNDRCGSLLSDIANGKKTTRVAPASTFDYFNSLDNFNLTNTNIMNPFNFSNYQIPDGSGLPPVGSNIYPLWDDLNGVSIFPQINNPISTIPPTTTIATIAGVSNPSQDAISPNSGWDTLSLLVANLWSNVKTGVKNIPQTISNWLNKLVQFASSFIGKINSDKEGNRMFSGGKAQAWCADFVTYCVKKTLGNKLPSDFGSSAVSGLRDWGIKHGCYTTAPEPRTEAAMRNYLKTKVRPGDIMIQKRNGRSHTGIVQSVAADGSTYTVVEGNSSDKVQTVKYNATNGYLSGFVSLAQYA